ncbi:hypothetical protein F5Y11DRAFT_362362 [Daldinia sp. FL1419]|nr:hypothetical protein F5Y11DRAFT_362362 [Daldinia sp. FL1419]
MCLVIYAHFTTREHDSRFPSIINAATRYTVLSPWQDPAVRKCDQPHMDNIEEDLKCDWHPGCCRLEILPRCNSVSGGCKIWCRYHHFIDRGRGDTNDGAFLGYFTPNDSTLLLTASWLFKSGVEAYSLRQNLAILPPAAHDEQPSTSLIRKRLEDSLSQATDDIGQFAILWDRKTSDSGFHQLPWRPGAERDPRDNKAWSEDYLRLRVVDRGHPDPSLAQWPSYVRLRQMYQGQILPAVPHSAPTIEQFSRNPNQGLVLPDPFALNGVLPPGQQQVQQVQLLQRQQLPLNPINSLDLSHVNPAFRSLTTPQDANSEAFSNSYTFDDIPANILPKEPTYTIPSFLSAPSTFAQPLPAVNPNGALGSLEQEVASSPIECLVEHKPFLAKRRGIKQYRVRWARDWVPKEEWVPASNIGESLIDEYWRKCDEGKAPWQLRRGALNLPNLGR